MKINPTISLEDFFQKVSTLSTFLPSSAVAVGVSGGIDSLCLAILLKKFCEKSGLSLIALIVDHKLREQSTNEAQYVRNILKEQGINSVILNREAVPLSSKIQQIAREDRYNLLKTYCFENKIAHLFTGHHRDDDVETLIMRLQKGENFVGGAGISAKLVTSKVIILRPLLSYNKNILKNTLQIYTKKWVEDASNENEKFKRVEIRKQYQNSDQQVKLLEQLFQQRQVYEQKIVEFLSKYIKINALGVVIVDNIKFSLLSEDIKVLILRKLLQFCSNSPFQASIASTLYTINQLNTVKQATLGKCFIFKKQNTLRVAPYGEERNLFKTFISKNEFKHFLHKNSLTLQTARAFYILQDQKYSAFIYATKYSILMNYFAKV